MVRTSAASGRRPLDGDDDAPRELADEIEMALIQVASDTLRRLDAALDRLARGRYGDCAECAEPIAERRLEALPFAIRCVDCETSREESHGRRPAGASRHALEQALRPDHA